MKGDRYKIINDNGELCGYGYGHEQLAEGEYRVPIDTEEEMFSDNDVNTLINETENIDSIVNAKSANRTQAFTTKAYVFRKFLKKVPDTGESGEEALSLIDDDEYMELYNEYKQTHHLLNGATPWDLCRVVKDKAQKCSDAEVQRRVDILNCENEHKKIKKQKIKQQDNNKKKYGNGKPPTDKEQKRTKEHQLIIKQKQENDNAKN